MQYGNRRSGRHSRSQRNRALIARDVNFLLGWAITEHGSWVYRLACYGVAFIVGFGGSAVLPLKKPGRAPARLTRSQEAIPRRWGR